jgi:hypothetical protein
MIAADDRVQYKARPVSAIRHLTGRRGTVDTEGRSGCPIGIAIGDPTERDPISRGTGPFGPPV